MFWMKKVEVSSFDSLCSKISTGIIQSSYEKGSLYQAITLVILQGAWQAKERLLKYPELGGLFRKTNHDIITIEFSMAIQSRLAYSLMLNPFELDEDEEEEAAEAVYNALGLICSFGEKAGFSGLDKKVVTRSYSQKTEQSVEMLISVLRASVGLKNPISRLSRSSASGDLLQEVSLSAAVMSLWGTIILGTVESCQNICRAHFSGEI